MSAAALHQAAGQRTVRASSGPATRRVRAFTAFPAKARQPSGSAAVVPRAAAVEEAATEEEFSFSFADAKKQNEYTPEDVAAAMGFYSGAGDSAPIHNEDFIVNQVGVEDASFFDDVDNNEAYQDDEFIAAGIPEAAPKRRGRGRRQDGAAEEEEDDDVQRAKALEKVKALEDRMVLEAALEEEFGSGTKSAAAENQAPKSGVWEWLTDFSATAEAVEGVEGIDVARLAARKRSDAPMLSDAELATDVNNLTAEAMNGTAEEQEVFQYKELFMTEGDISAETLALVDAEDTEEDPVSTITEEELERLEALASIEVPTVEIADPQELAAPMLLEETPLDQAVMDNYLTAIRDAATSSSNMTEEEVRALFGDIPLVEEQPDEVSLSSEEVQALLNTPSPKLEAINIDLEAQASEIETMAGELEEEDDEGLARELAALNQYQPMTEEDLPAANQMELLEQYIAAAEDWVAAEETRRAEIAQAVASGELSADALADELEDVPDVMDELLAADAAEEDAEASMVVAEEEQDKENWTERIIELKRVTKVVKGGKLMGFRCVAIVGNQNGLVGVGCMSGREVAVAVKRTLVDAKKNVVSVPLVGAGTIPHKAEAKYHAARCVIVPASDGTGCIAGGSIRSVLELAGVRNVLGKRLGSRSALNSARATVKALQSLQTLDEVSAVRNIPFEQLLLPSKKK